MKFKTLISVLVFAASFVATQAQAFDLGRVRDEWDRFRVNQGFNQLDPTWNGLAFGVYNATTGVVVPGKELVNTTGAQSMASKTLTDAVVRQAVTTISGDGAVTIASGIVLLTKGSAAAITVAAPSSVNGTRITIMSNSDFAHVVTFTGGTLLDGTTGANTTATFAAFKGASITVVAVGATWLVESFNAVTIAP